MLFNEILEKLRETGAGKLADTLQWAVNNERAKVDKLEQMAMGATVERVLRKQIEEGCAGRPVVMPGRLMHLEELVRDAVGTLREKKNATVVPKKKEEQGAVEAGGVEKRGTGRMSELEEVLAGLGMAVQQDGYTVMIGQDRGDVIVTLMSNKLERGLVVKADTVLHALADAIGKLMRLS